MEEEEIGRRAIMGEDIGGIERAFERSIALWKGYKGICRRGRVILKVSFGRRVRARSADSREVSYGVRSSSRLGVKSDRSWDGKARARSSEMREGKVGLEVTRRMISKTAAVRCGRWRTAVYP